MKVDWSRPQIMSSGARFFSLLLVFFCALLLSRCEVEGDNEAPARITDLHFFERADALAFNHEVSEVAASGLPNTRLLAWTASGDDGSQGRASLYYLKYLRVSDLSRFPAGDPAKIMVTHWEEMRNLTHEPFPLPAGSLEQVFLPTLSMGESVWLAISVADEIGQESKVSNVVGPLRLNRLQIAVRPVAGSTVAGFGQSLAGAGDVNGDGVKDLLLSSPATGQAMLVLGKKSSDLIQRLPNAQGIKTLRAISELSPALTISGATTDEFASRVAALFQVNSDSLADFAVAAPSADPSGRTNAGAVYIFYGQKSPPATLSSAEANIVLTGVAAGDSFGFSVGSGFDLDQDSRTEFLVGAPGAFSGRGAVYIFRSKNLVSGDASLAVVELRGESVGDRFGAVVASVGDVNGDQVPDFAVAAPERKESGNLAAGAVYIFYGGNAGAIKFGSLGSGGTVIDLSVKKADVTIRGTAANRRLGRIITAGGNVAGDTDSAYDFALAGGDTVWVFFGGANRTLPFPRQSNFSEGTDLMASARLSGAPAEGFAQALAGPGNLNKDQADDLVVGAPLADRCYIFFGPIQDGQSPKLTLQGTPLGKGFGQVVVGVGDLSLDGFVDLLIAAPAAGEAYFSF